MALAVTGGLVCAVMLRTTAAAAAAAAAAHVSRPCHHRAPYPTIALPHRLPLTAHRSPLICRNRRCHCLPYRYAANIRKNERLT